MFLVCGERGDKHEACKSLQCYFCGKFETTLTPQVHAIVGRRDTRRDVILKTRLPSEIEAERDDVGVLLTSAVLAQTPQTLTVEKPTLLQLVPSLLHRVLGVNIRDDKLFIGLNISHRMEGYLPPTIAFLDVWGAVYITSATKGREGKGWTYYD